MAFIKSNYNTFITYNPDFHSEYHVYTAMIYLLNNYTNYGKDFDYTQSEFLYYTAMINHTGNNASYIDYLLGKIENNTISGNSFLNNYAMNNMTQAQYDYYYILTQLAGKDAIIRNDLMGFISGFASYNYQPLSKNTFDKYFSEFQSGKGQSYFCDKYGWNQKEYNYYKKMFSMIIKNQNNISNSGNYTSSYEYYKDLLDAMSGYQLYQKDFQYSKIEFDYYISLYQSVSGYMSYKDYVANSDYSTSTYEFYSSIYNTNIKLQEKFKTFEEFFAYVNSVGYEAMLIEFELDSYVAAYDDKVGEDAEDASGINKGELSNKWYSYSFSYKDDILGIPFAVNHLLEKSGFQCNQKDMPIAEGKEINITLIKGKSIINAVVKNNKNKEIPVKECDVISISISQNMSEEDLKDFEFPAGIKIGDKKDKIENVYGAPYDQNSSKGLTHFYYRSSKKNETMKMIFSNNVLTKITLSKT